MSIDGPDKGETGCRTANHLREPCRDVINGRNDPPVPVHFNQPNYTLKYESRGSKGRPHKPRIPQKARNALHFQARNYGPELRDHVFGARELI